MIEIKNIKELNNYKNSKVLLKLFTTWCGPCKLLAPEFKEANKKNQNNIVFLSANSEIALDISKLFNITGVPTIILFDFNLKEIKRFSGFRDANFILDFIS